MIRNGSPDSTALRADLARASAALRAGRVGETEGICQDVLRAPDLPAELRDEALKLRINAVSRLDGLGHAITLLEWSTRGSPGNPAWLTMLAELYRRAGRIEEALTAASEVAVLLPRNASALIALTRLHADRADKPEAMRCCLAALSIEPDNAAAHMALAQLLLSTGDYEAGWVEYEWRHKLDAQAPTARWPTLPHWNGMRLPAGHLLLYNEQGIGDAFQFARYVPWARDRTKRVSLVCQNAALPVLSRIDGLFEAVSHRSDVAGPTVQAPLGSLPGLFRATPTTIPNGPYLTTDAARTKAWSGRLDAALRPGSLRVGLVWAGQASHSNDQRRSVPLALCCPILECRGISIVALQKDKRPGDDTILSRYDGVLDLGMELTDFGETAAIMANLDIIISICSAVTHLAGALGLRVWVMLSEPAEWRWLEGRSDSPWYQSARLFRQSRRGDWGRVVSDVVAALMVEAGVVE